VESTRGLAEKGPGVGTCLRASRPFAPTHRHVRLGLCLASPLPGALPGRPSREPPSGGGRPGSHRRRGRSAMPSGPRSVPRVSVSCGSRRDPRESGGRDATRRSLGLPIADTGVAGCRAGLPVASKHPSRSDRTRRSPPRPLGVPGLRKTWPHVAGGRVDAPSLGWDGCPTHVVAPPRPMTGRHLATGRSVRRRAVVALAECPTGPGRGSSPARRRSCRGPRS
jgi:hypothetical protein